VLGRHDGDQLVAPDLHHTQAVAVERKRKEGDVHLATVQQYLTGGRRLRRACRAHEEGDSERFLEGSDLLADRGLTQLVPLRFRRQLGVITGLVGATGGSADSSCRRSWSSSRSHRQLRGADSSSWRSSACGG
jgi:hypothetical protein